MSSEKLHICYVIAPGGGPETYVRNLAPWLTAQGHRVSVVTLGKELHFPPEIKTVCARGAVKHYWVSKFFGNFRQWALRLRSFEWEQAIKGSLEEIERTRKVDLVEVTEGISIGLLRKRWKVVVRIHGSDWSFRHFCRDEGSRNDYALIQAEKKQLEQANGVISISRHSADHVSKACHFSRNLIEVIPYPVVQHFKYKRDGNKPENRILSVGRLEKRKGTHTLVQAMEIVWKKFPEIELCLFGHEAGFSKEQLLRMVSEKNRSKIGFMGFVSQETLADYYSKSVLYAAPTQYETFGYTLLEAMSFALPVVTTAVGAIPELIEDGVNGKLVPYGDFKKLAGVITELIEDPLQREKMGENGLRKAGEYTLEKIAPRTLEFYFKTLKADS